MACDLSFSLNENVLISAMNFIKTLVNLQSEMNKKENQITPNFFHFSYFDILFMPLLRNFAMIDEQSNLDADYAEFWTPHLAAQDLLVILIKEFPEHSEKNYS